jgi:hypothetical protein
MSIVPVEMPNPLPVNAKTFDLGYIQDMTPVGAGFIQTIERSSALWMASYTTPPLSNIREQAFQAFIDSLYGAQGSFLGFDPRRPRPLNSGASGSPWAATLGVQPTCTAASYADGQLAVSLLAVGFQFAPGDYVAFQRSNAWYLHRVIIPATVAGDGTVTLNVVPRPISSSTVVNCRFNRAACAMKIIGKVNKADKVLDSGPTYTFTAAQFIDRT